jgi:hypothetical protein
MLLLLIVWLEYVCCSAASYHCMARAAAVVLLPCDSDITVVCFVAGVSAAGDCGAVVDAFGGTIVYNRVSHHSLYTQGFPHHGLLPPLIGVTSLCQRSD